MKTNYVLIPLAALAVGLIPMAEQQAKDGGSCWNYYGEINCSLPTNGSYSHTRYQSDEVFYSNFCRKYPEAAQSEPHKKMCDKYAEPSQP